LLGVLRSSAQAAFALLKIAPVVTIIPKMTVTNNIFNLIFIMIKVCLVAISPPPEHLTPLSARTTGKEECKGKTLIQSKIVRVQFYVSERKFFLLIPGFSEYQQFSFNFPIHFDIRLVQWGTELPWGA
jgi:hypothetical protein